jgi:hypothetical protein
MKRKSTLSSFATCIFLCLLGLYTLAAPVPGKTETGEKEKTTKKAKTTSSRNNSSVKIYPDPVRRIMHVSAKENNGKEIDFFVFGLDGTLIKHYKMTGGGHEKITGLERGKYVYNVFSGDEETAAGQFEIR